jgi:hypothetical protein
MSDGELLREMIREVIVEDWKTSLAGAALAICTAAGCAPVKAPDGGVASPADYGISDPAEEEGEEGSTHAPIPNKLRHPNPLRHQEPDLSQLGRR